MRSKDDWIRDYSADIAPIQERYPALMRYLHFGTDAEVKQEIIKLVKYTDELETDGINQLRLMFPPEVSKARKSR